MTEVGAATKFLNPLLLLPLPWLTETATATNATFSKSRNRYALLRYSATARVEWGSAPTLREICSMLYISKLGAFIRFSP